MPPGLQRLWPREGKRTTRGTWNGKTSPFRPARTPVGRCRKYSARQPTASLAHAKSVPIPPNNSACIGRRWTMHGAPSGSGAAAGGFGKGRAGRAAQTSAHRPPVRTPAKVRALAQPPYWPRMSPKARVRPLGMADMSPPPRSPALPSRDQRSIARNRMSGPPTDVPRAQRPCLPWPPHIRHSARVGATRRVSAALGAWRLAIVGGGRCSSRPAAPPYCSVRG